MDCHIIDEQVVRLEKIKDIADQFIRVRVTRIESLDLNLFKFDLDLTMMIFFLDADGKMYARYGGRGNETAHARKSLTGLRFTMRSVLKEHRSKTKRFAPRDDPKSLYARGITGRFRGGGCMHCHHVKERMLSQAKRNGVWTRDLIYRYPLPDNLGVVLDVDRSNVVKRVLPDSPAAHVGVKPSDIVTEIAGVPIHSFGDAQFALDRVRKKRNITISWRRNEKEFTRKLTLADGWHMTSISWRPSVFDLMPSPHTMGKDLTFAEKKALGLGRDQLAFWQRERIHYHAKKSGIRPGDVIVGVDGKKLEMNVYGFTEYVGRNYLIGDRVEIDLIRNGKRMKAPMKLIR